MIVVDFQHAKILFSNHSPKSKTLVVIPILNEGKRILNQLSRMQGFGMQFDIAIVDGDSKDGSVEEIVEKNLDNVIIIIKDSSKIGLSRQLQIGLAFGLKNDYQHIITMDGNNKDNPNGISEIVNALDLGYDFVQGSRFVPGGEAINNPRVRTLAIKLIHAPITSLLARFRFTDSTNGFRGFSRRILSDSGMNIFDPRFKTYELVAYIPVRAAKLSYRLCEVGVIREYPTENGIPTKIVGVKANLRIFWILLRQCTAARFN
jgi:dolichol-phosphate mannosyltransferase